MKPAYVLLKIDTPVYIVVKYDNYDLSDETEVEALNYRVEEGDCPTDILGRAVAVIENGQDDSHGFAFNIRAVNLDAEPQDWTEVFPETKA